MLTSHIIIVYSLVLVYGGAGAHLTYAHARKLRETYAYATVAFATLCPLLNGEALATAESGRCVYPSAELDIHVVRRRERLATETTEERDTPVPALCSIHAMYSLFLAII